MLLRHKVCRAERKYSKQLISSAFRNDSYLCTRNVESERRQHRTFEVKFNIFLNRDVNLAHETLITRMSSPPSMGVSHHPILISQFLFYNHTPLFEPCSQNAENPRILTRQVRKKKTSPP